jgi:hypothetical protein
MVADEQASPHGEASAGRKFSAPYQRSFPLIALFQLATCWAALAMCVDGNRLRDVLNPQGNILYWSWEPWLAVTGAALPAALLGFILGLGQLRMARGAGLGLLVGGLCGLALLAVYVAPAPPMRVAAASALVLATTIAFRVRSA